MRLPRYVTGFWSFGDVAPAAIDEREFRGVCHAAARVTGGRVTGCLSGGAARNYTTARIAYPERERAVLCNLYSPLVAIAEPMGMHELIPVFVGDPQLAQAIGDFSRFRVLWPKDLATPLTECDLSELGDAELAQIHDWKPDTAGQVLFNFWD